MRHILIILSLIITQSAFAELGGNESRINDEVKSFKAHSHKKIQRNGYSVHELSLDGVIVKEFVSPAGEIFAVTWHGMRAPNLKILFGSSYIKYDQERKKIKFQRGRRNMSVSTSDLVVSSGGHMRDMHGFAYLPAKVPPGVELNNIQ
jgi:hypothetical protein